MIFDKLDADFGDDPVLVAGPASKQDADAIEAFAGFTLPESYREFIARYGAAIVGSYPVYGSGASEAMGSQQRSVIEVTQRFRADAWPHSDEGLVVSMDHAGNAMILDANGRVRRYDHDGGIDEVISDTFESFLEWSLARSG